MKFNVEVITPAVAAEYLKSNGRNRNPNMGISDYYAKLMRNGEWELNGESIKFSQDGRLLDGQHRLMACVSADVPFETVVVRDVDEKSFSTLDQGWIRKRGQVFAIAGIVNYANIAACINKYLVMGVSRVTAMESAGTGLGNGSRHRGKDFKLRKFSAKECLQEYDKRSDYWQNLINLAGCMYKRCRLMKQSDIASIMAHLNLRCGYEFPLVVGFFDQLFFEEKTKMNIIRILRNRLVNDSMNSTRMTSQMRTQLIRKTWDCYKQNRDPRVLKWVKGTEEELPFS